MRSFLTRVPQTARWGAAATLAAVLAAPSAMAADTALKQLRAFADGTRAASGAFSQSTAGQGSQAAPAQSGRFSFERPGRFRWHVQAPHEQVLVSDGKTLHQYDPDLAQVTVSPVGQAIGASPAQILFGSGSLEQAFDIKEQPARDGLAWLRAQPKSPDAGFSRVDIGFKDGLPQRLELLDAFGQTTRVVLTGIQRNPALPADTFRFTPPAGTDVVQLK